VLQFFNLGVNIGKLLISYTIVYYHKEHIYNILVFWVSVTINCVILDDVCVYVYTYLRTSGDISVYFIHLLI